MEHHLYKQTSVQAYYIIDWLFYNLLPQDVDDAVMSDKVEMTQTVLHRLFHVGRGFVITTSLLQPEMVSLNSQSLPQASVTLPTYLYSSNYSN